MRIACAALTTLNRLFLRAAPVISGGKRFPPLYRSGVRYRRQLGPERFLPIPIVFRRRYGDCDQLAAWRAAELQERGVAARAVPRMVTPRLMHVVVVYPDPRNPKRQVVEDPSRRLGMGGKG